MRAALQSFLAVERIIVLGFLGAGGIIKEGFSVRGLTTAASIWMTASIGVLIGVGFYFPALVTTLLTLGALSPIRFPCSPEWWRSNEALQAEAQAPQAPREQRHQAAGNIPALRSRGLFSAGVRFSTASHMPVDTAQWRASDSTSTSRSSRSVRAM